MQLFSRMIHMAGPASEIGPHAEAMRAHASKKIGAEVALWSGLFGSPFGTMVYTTRVDGVAGVMANRAALAGDEKYAKLAAKGSEWATGPAVDTLRESLKGELAATSPPIGSVATVTTAVIADGRYAEAIGWGLEISTYVEGVTGMPIGFMMDMFGTFGQVVWIGVAQDAAAADTANAKLNADAAYVTKLGDAGKLFVAGMSHRQMAVRVG